MDIIIPAAGKSTRYLGVKPKYLLYDYKGRLAISNVIRPYLTKGHTVTVVILKEHDEKFRATDHIRNAFPFENTVKIVILDDPTSGPAETVYRGLDKIEGSFLVKDCDNFFYHNILPNNTNTVYVSTLENVDKPASKSFVIHNNENIITSIVEKKVVSDVFACGGYLFASVDEYKKAYEDVVKSATSEVFVSHIINYMIHSQNSVFTSEKVSGLVDLGTQKEWDEWNDKPTIFCDIDGTLVWSQDRLSYDKPHEPHDATLSLLFKKIKEGCQIVFTTARPEHTRPVTRKMLNDLGFSPDTQLIMGLHNAKRILINDYNTTTNKYPTAIAYNVFRDGDDLDMMWK
jgi:hypothetical protein